MTYCATFDEDDLKNLSGQDRKTLRILQRTSLGFEPLAKSVGVGQKSMDALILKGLAVEGMPGLHGRTFKVSDKGWLAIEWMRGNRMREYPSS